MTILTRNCQDCQQSSLCSTSSGPCPQAGCSSSDQVKHLFSGLSLRTTQQESDIWSSNIRSNIKNWQIWGMSDIWSLNIRVGLSPEEIGRTCFPTSASSPGKLATACPSWGGTSFHMHWVGWVGWEGHFLKMLIGFQMIWTRSDCVRIFASIRIKRIYSVSNVSDLCAFEKNPNERVWQKSEWFHPFEI